MGDGIGGKSPKGGVPFVLAPVSTGVPDADPGCGGGGSKGDKLVNL